MPFAPDRHGPQSETTIGPACPGLPLWMWAPVELLLRLAKVSRHLRLPVFPVCVSLLVNVPCALGALTTCFGTSWLAVSFASTVEPAECTATAAPASARALTANATEAAPSILMVV